MAPATAQRLAVLITEAIHARGFRATVSNVADIATPRTPSGYTWEAAVQIEGEESQRGIGSRATPEECAHGLRVIGHLKRGNGNGLGLTAIPVPSLRRGLNPV